MIVKMFNQTSLLLFLLGLGINIIWLSCANSNSNNIAKIDYHVLSMEYCKCAQESIEVNRQMQVLFERNKNEEIERLIPQVSRAFKQSIDCSQQAKNVLSRKALDKQQLEDALKIDCPEMPERLVNNLLEKVN